MRSFFTDDGTLIVTTEYNGTYFLYQGTCIFLTLYHYSESLYSCTYIILTYACVYARTLYIMYADRVNVSFPPPLHNNPLQLLDGSYTLVLDKSVVIGQVVVAHKHHLLLFRTGQLLRETVCIEMVPGK